MSESENVVGTEWAVLWDGSPPEAQIEECDNETRARDIVEVYPRQARLVSRTVTRSPWMPA